MKLQIENGILIKATGKDKIVVIPPEVTAIGEKAFCDMYDLEKVVIPGTVKTVGKCAFCYNRMKELVLEEGVEEVGEMSFSSTKIETLTLPQSLKKIGKEAFYYCDQLREVVFPENLAEMEDGAFYGCKALTEVTIPRYITRLGEKAFCYCESLQRVSLPEGLRVIGKEAFVLCRNLRQINLPETLEEIGESAFSEDFALAGVKLPTGLKSVGPSAFSRCKAMADENGMVILGDTVYNYYGPGGDVVIPDGIRRLERLSFWDGSDVLTGITIPDSVEYIGEHAFWNCKKLVSLRLPEKLPYIDDTAFEGCTGLLGEDGLAIAGDILVAWRKDPERVEIPEGIGTIGAECFANTIMHDWNRKNAQRIQEVILPQSLKRIGYSAFRSNINLAKINLPEGLEEIGGYAFEKCAALPALELPAGLTAIGMYAFRDCTGMSPNQVIPGGVKNLPKTAFDGVALQSISMGAEAFEGWSKDAPAKSNMGVVVREGEKVRYYGLVSKANADTFHSFILPGNWNAYDLDLINNGPEYKYKAPARLLGTLGRLVDPVDLTDECRELHLEFLIKNAKKLIPIAEALRCPEIIRDMATMGIINPKNKKAIAKLLAASPVAEIAALADL